VAGPLTFAVFAAGIIGTGMLALPALAGSAAYALGETLSWHVGLARLLRRAKAFSTTIAVGMVLGVALNFSPIDPIKVAFAALAQREGVSRSYFTRLVRLSYIAPDITQAILDGRQPRDLTPEKLLEHSRLPLAWHDQRIVLGFG
jgi:hypothetical protein